MSRMSSKQAEHVSINIKSTVMVWYRQFHVISTGVTAAVRLAAKWEAMTQECKTMWNFVSGDIYV